MILVLLKICFIDYLGPVYVAGRGRGRLGRLENSKAKLYSLFGDRVGVGHTGERAAILKLHFHEFDEKELLRAEFL